MELFGYLTLNIFTPKEINKKQFLLYNGPLESNPLEHVCV